VSGRGVACTLDRVFQAWDYVRVEGGLHGGVKEIVSVRLVDGELRPIAGGQGMLEPGATGDARFTLSCLAGESLQLLDCWLEVGWLDGLPSSKLPLREQVHGPGDPSGLPLFERFRALVGAHPSPRVLEVGGRARSGVLHRELLGPVAEYVGVDVLPGEGVDVVADAHGMSGALGRERFDFACSYYVWEHLAMPWKVVVELNRVLVEGAYAYIVAPQTCGMHDLPWDYFRFSDSAFRALFAPETGFEVVDVARAEPMHVFPFFSRRETTQDELTAGFFSVVVLVRKTGPTTLEWSADPGGVVDAPYPE
jgi:hypothetical protein